MFDLSRDLQTCLGALHSKDIEGSRCRPTVASHYPTSWIIQRENDDTAMHVPSIASAVRALERPLSSGNAVSSQERIRLEIFPPYSEHRRAKDRPSDLAHHFKPILHLKLEVIRYVLANFGCPPSEKERSRADVERLAGVRRECSVANVLAR